MDVEHRQWQASSPVGGHPFGFASAAAGIDEIGREARGFGELAHERRQRRVASVPMGEGRAGARKHLGDQAQMINVEAVAKLRVRREFSIFRVIFCTVTVTRDHRNRVTADPNPPLVRNQFSRKSAGTREALRMNARLEEALAAYRAALESPAHTALDRALTQTNLGDALWRVGARESKTTRLEEAIATYRAALKTYTLAAEPLEWAATQNNLGFALWVLGERESMPARIEEAADALRASLEGYTHAEAALHIAITQKSLARCLAALERYRAI
ncbi:MAG: hypothetical protein ACLPN5_09000 [Roseiarcus sp.]